MGQSVMKSSIISKEFAAPCDLFKWTENGLIRQLDRVAPGFVVCQRVVVGIFTDGNSQDHIARIAQLRQRPSGRHGDAIARPQYCSGTFG